MSRISVFLSVCLFMIACIVPLAAQSTAGAEAVVPRLVNYSGKVVDAQGKSLSGVAGVTFAIYKDQEGGVALWMETQNVQADAAGHYTVQLGGSSSEGLPMDLFNNAGARWLGVRINDGEEQSRVLLLSVPYALKAADAETIGGLPPSAFVRSDAAPAAGSGTSGTTSTKTNSATAKTQTPPANPAVTGKGVANFVPMWDTTSDIVDSLIFQKSSLVGISTSTPAATLDVNGKGDIRDTLTLFPKGTDPTLAVHGTNFKVDATGKITFVSGQTFPGGVGSGTVTSVGLSAPSSDFTVSGSPITKSGTLGLNWSIAPTSAATANAIVKRDDSGSFSAAGISASTTGSQAIYAVGGSYGVYATGGGDGVYGTTTNAAGNGIWGYNPNHTGVYGDGGVGVWGHSGTGYGVYGASFGTTATSDGVHGEASSGSASGVAGVNNGTNGVGVYGVGSGYGVYGISGSGGGSGVGAINTSTGDALFADNQSGGFAGFFLGDVDVDGNLSKAGGSFKIDHPLDPANKYLYHSFVESPDMMNIYNGNVTTDSDGNAVVAMPDWFEALNQDFRYQLTVMGQFAQAIVAGKMANHSFAIKTDKPNVEVSWQVTGVRHDAWANAHRIPVEQLKADQDRGLYLHPELFGARPDQSIAVTRHPELKIVRENAQHQVPTN
jgi:trimeric autotransporter adhesin